MKRFAVVIIAMLTPIVAHAQKPLILHDGWYIQSSAKAGTDGAAMSVSSYKPAGWYRATVPSTVAGALVDDSLYGDPFFGMNLRKLPGMTYKIGANFVHTAMEPTSAFAVPWWYRSSFRVPESMRGKRLTLHFDGINYRANIWLNGKRLADSSTIAGTYRRVELDVTDAVRDGVNAIAVEVFAPEPADLQTTWVDWNPSPPDKNMGLWQPAYLTASGDVVVRYPEVVSRVDTAGVGRTGDGPLAGARWTARSAALTVVADLRNLAANPVSGTLRGRIGRIAFERAVTLAPHDSMQVRFTPDSFPQLRVTNPKLWWPAEFGKGQAA